tara:strand:+ start:567 stop:812 length:246 start_codon:yes stop_codon:yes gene_type:complete
MGKKAIIRAFQKEFVLSNKYEYNFDKDVCGKTIEVFVPLTDSKIVRKKLPRWWRNYRTIVLFKDTSKRLEEEEDDEEDYDE